MWFKNLQLHRLPAPWAVTPEQLEKWLAPHAFQPGNSVEKQTSGWASPREDGALVYSNNGQMLLTFRAEKKLLPASVINQVTKARALELEEKYNKLLEVGPSPVLASGPDSNGRAARDE